MKRHYDARDSIKADVAQDARATKCKKWTLSAKCLLAAPASAMRHLAQSRASRCVASIWPEARRNAMPSIGAYDDAAVTFSIFASCDRRDVTASFKSHHRASSRRACKHARGLVLMAGTTALVRRHMLSPRFLVMHEARPWREPLHGRNLNGA